MTEKPINECDKQTSVFAAEQRRQLWTRWQEVEDPERYAREILVPLLGDQMELVLHEEMDASQVQTLRGMEHFTGIYHLDLSWCEMVSDLTPLAGLSQLQTLNLLECEQVRDLAPLAGLTQLQKWDLNECEVEDLRALSGLHQMKELNLWRFKVSDLTPLCFSF